MTVIVASKTHMAADSLVADGDARSNGTKIFKSKKAIIGVAGDYHAARSFVAWYNDRRKKKPTVKGDWEALVWTPKEGLEWWDGHLEPMPIEEKEFWAIGSGRDAALAAMHLSGDPELAVEIACKVVVSCGMPTQIMKLEIDK